MKKDLLTVLSCSSSLAFALWSGSPASADSGFSVREYVFTAPAGASLEDCGCTFDPAVDADFTEEEGIRAIERFGCDCAGCRYIVRSETAEAKNPDRPSEL
jgi:hypothetical protein